MLESAARRPSGPYLFVGAPGGGQRTAARLFAAAIACRGMCGECSTCTRIIRGVHPDVTILQPEGYTYPVEVLRAGVAAAAQTPIEASHRTFILEEADRVTERSQNALLKALEEPGSRVVWILVADSVHPFLPTILSRCQVVSFPAVGEAVLLRLLHQKSGLRPEEASEIVRVARGDLDTATRLAEQPLMGELRLHALQIAANPNPSLKAILHAVDAVMAMGARARDEAESAQAEESRAWSDTGKSHAATALQKRLASSHKRALRRIETEVLIDYLSWLGAAFRDMTVISSGGTDDSLVFADTRAEVAARERPPKFWIDMVEACLEAQLALRSNASPALVLESVLLRLV